MAKQCPKCQFDNASDSKFCKECGTQLGPPKDIGVTKTIETPVEEYPRGSTFADRYKIIEKLGIGGMGAVYRVEDTNIGQDIALKLIKSDIASDKKTIERFRNELKTTRMISHRNVCRMFDLAETEGTYYITMEYVSGEDLKSFIRRSGKLDIPKAISIAKEVCEGLSEAHRLGVVHRDLKSNNIMIDKEGNARIMDFGIARSLRAKGLTGEGIIIGTPEYMSPEQAEAKEVDHRSDIYSLGVILYEMVIGQLPFEGDTPLSIAMKHKGETPKDPKKLNAQIPDDLSHLILRCLEKDKDARYQSAGEVQSELDRIEKRIPSTEPEITKRKPLTSREITVQFSIKKLFIPIIAITILAIIALIIWKLLPREKTVPIASGKPSVAVIYFKNNTGDENLDIWRSALAEMLISDLSQSRLIRVLSDDRIFSILSQLNLLEAKSYSTEDLKKIATRGGATHILRGTITKSGSSFRINTTLQESSTMEIIGSRMVEGKGEGSFHTMVDELTVLVKKNFKISEEEIAGDIDMELGKISTSSPEAFKYYSEGRKYFRKGDYQKSIELMKKALTIDPEFAMAYRSLAVSYGNLSLVKNSRESSDKAFELSDRVSIRERYLIQAGAERDLDKQIEAYKKLLELYPEDRIGNINLGVSYFNLEQFDKAIERFNVSIGNENIGIQVYMMLANAYGAKGMYDEAKEVLEDYLNNISDNAAIHESLSTVYLCQGEYDLALDEIEKAFSINPNDFGFFRTKGDIFYCKEDLDKAEKEYQKLLEIEEQSAHMLGRKRLGFLYLLQGRIEKTKSQWKQGLELAKSLTRKSVKWNFHSNIAYLYLFSGELKGALDEFNKAWDNAVEVDRFDHRRKILYWKGRTYLEMKSMDEAKKTAVELKEFIQKGMNKKSIRLYHHLMGMIEFEKENFSAAIEYFNKAISLLPSQNYYGYGFFRAYGYQHAIFIDSLAMAYFKIGDFKRARKEYEKILSLTLERLYYGDIYAKSFYMLGKIHEQQGDTAKAIDQYEKFLSLWKDADQGIAEVDDAKQRLGGLKGK